MTGPIEIHSDGSDDWFLIDPAGVIEEFEWLAGHLGHPGDERRVTLAFREPSGVHHVFALGAPTARAMAAELARRADAPAPPEPHEPR